jgi:hypothetical protein
MRLYGGVQRVVLFVVSRIASPTYVQRKFRTKYHKTPQRMPILRGAISLLKLAVYLRGSQAGVDLAMQMRRQKMGGRSSLFAAHENQLSTPAWS